MKKLLRIFYVVFHAIYLVTIPIIGGVFTVKFVMYCARDKGFLDMSDEKVISFSMLLGLIVGSYPLIEFVVREKPWLTEKYDKQDSL